MEISHSFGYYFYLLTLLGVRIAEMLSSPIDIFSCQPTSLSWFGSTEVGKTWKAFAFPRFSTWQTPTHSLRLSSNSHLLPCEIFSYSPSSYPFYCHSTAMLYLCLYFHYDTLLYFNYELKCFSVL